MELPPLIDAACERAGSSDFGDDTWQEGLEILVRSLTEEASLNDLGVSAMTDQIVGSLTSRLRVEQCHAAHPGMAEQPITAPLFGLGLPRTGSTALSFLLAQDPARRSLRVWEAADPCPPPETATEYTDPRIAVAQAGIDVTNELFPGLAGMLPSAADGPQECLLPMALDFRSILFEGMATVPGYAAWLRQCDMEPAYRYHRRVLQLLQWRCPPDRWWLKTPAHMLSIDALDAVYPDARFVMTHRDVGKVLPSVSALYCTFIEVLSERCDPVAVGNHSRATWRTALERLIAFRDDGGHDHRFLDVSFEAVQRDPFGSVARLYDQLGDPLTDEARRRMEAWWARSAADRSGPGNYPLETYGLDLRAIAAEFAFYTDRFDVPVAVA